LVMELCRSTIDSNIIKDDVVKRYFRQLLEGLDYLQLNNIAHHGNYQKQS